MAEPAAPYTTIEESEAEEMARIMWEGWDFAWEDTVGQIQDAARRLHSMGYRRRPTPAELTAIFGDDPA